MPGNVNATNARDNELAKWLIEPDGTGYFDVFALNSFADTGPKNETPVVPCDVAAVEAVAEAIFADEGWGGGRYDAVVLARKALRAAATSAR